MAALTTVAKMATVEATRDRVHEARTASDFDQSSRMLDDWVEAGRQFYHEQLHVRHRQMMMKSKKCAKRAPNHVARGSLNHALSSVVFRSSDSDGSPRSSRLTSMGSELEHDMAIRSSMASSDEPRDKEMQRFMKQVEKSGYKEHVTLMKTVAKTNSYGKVQKRLLVVTDVAVYNCSTDAKEIKRRIELENIEAITIDVAAGTGEPGRQFVLHVPKEYDYLLAIPDKVELAARDDIIRVIQGAHSQRLTALGRQDQFDLPVDVFHEDPKGLNLASVMSNKKS